MKRFFAGVAVLAFLVLSSSVSFAQCNNYVGSKGSDKYHTVDCGIGKNINPENQVCFDTQEAAQKAGHKPCGVCKPDENLKVVGSKDSDKYHLPTCGIAKNIKPENLVEFKYPADAVKAGYKPCGVCKPPKVEEKK